MIKSEIFASVLRDVCEVTGISERDIMSKSKSEEIVDARHLLVGFSQVGTGQYVAVVRVQGCICYNPCGTDGCCSRTETVSQTFTIPFESATAPTSVTVAAGNTVNAVSVTGCQSCGRTFVSETPLTLTVA